MENFIFCAVILSFARYDIRGNTEFEQEMISLEERADRDK